MVEGMSVVVNVMLSLMSVMSPPPCLMQPVGTHGGEVMYFGCVCFRGGVWILCVDGRSRYLNIVRGGYLRILGAPSVQSCCTLWISAS